MNAVLPLQEEITALKAQLENKSNELKNKDTQLENKNNYIRQLEELIKSYKQKQFGASSEKQHPDQQQLFNEAEADLEADLEEDSEGISASTEAAEITVARHTRKKKPRISIPADIPREAVVYDLSESEKICPHDGTELKHIGDDTHEQLDIVPAQIKVIAHIRKKYACPCCEQHIITAKKPKQPIEKSMASPGLLATVATHKYCDHLPLYRQSEMFKRIGVELDRSNLANWMIRSGELIQPLINLMQERVLNQPVVHMDETPVQVLNEPGKKPESKSYMWLLAAFTQQPVMLFHYAPTRSGEIASHLLQGYSKALMVDGYSGYNSVCHQNQLSRLGCWAHARRKFVEAQKIQPKGKTGKADQALAFIQKLYTIERKTKERPADERQKIRQQQARPIIDKLNMWLEKSVQNVPPKMALGKALHYLHEQWPYLIRYLENGDYPIDNNLAENTIRPFTLGRKNWLFSNSQAGAKASANLYSLIETAKTNGLNPYEYLKHVFTELPNAEILEEVEALLPWNVKDVLG